MAAFGDDNDLGGEGRENDGKRWRFCNTCQIHNWDSMCSNICRCGNRYDIPPTQMSSVPVSAFMQQNVPQPRRASPIPQLPVPLLAVSPLQTMSSAMPLAVNTSPVTQFHILPPSPRVSPTSSTMRSTSPHYMSMSQGDLSPYIMASRSSHASPTEPMLSASTPSGSLSPQQTLIADSLQCPICQRFLHLSTPTHPQPGGSIVLGCGHSFHANCFVGWTNARRNAVNCPLCRHDFLREKIMA